jgi:hypothetical protein
MVKSSLSAELKVCNTFFSPRVDCEKVKMALTDGE